MRILLVNTIQYKNGGPSIHTFDLAELLRSQGHEVALFGMKDSRNVDTKYAELFPSKIDFPKLLQEGKIKNGLKVFKRTIYSKESRNSIREVIEDFKPDVLHLQNYLHHLSPSIIEPAKEKNIPVIWTLHDSVLACPNTNLFNDRTKKPCRKCNSKLKRLVLPALQRCKKGSFLASLMASMEAFNFELLNLKKKIDFFISPSKFLIENLNEMGVKTDKFRYLPNFVKFNKESPRKGEYALYFGRLVQEKGVFDLLEAFSKLEDIELVIVGGGPEENNMHQFIEDNKMDHVKMTGHLQGEELKDYIKNSRFVIIPSRCYDNAPLSIIEAMIYSKPVIGADIGGIPELIDEDKTGYIFKSGDIESLRNYVENLWEKPEKCMEMGRSASKIAKEKHSADSYLEKIVELYQKAIS